MANSLMSILSGITGGSGNMFMQAVGAFMRGESPQDFLRNMAQTNPALRGIDLNDINGSAQRICQEHGVDADKLASEIKSKLPSGRG